MDLYVWLSSEPVYSSLSVTQSTSSPLPPAVLNYWIIKKKKNKRHVCHQSCPFSNHHPRSRLSLHRPQTCYSQNSGVLSKTPKAEMFHFSGNRVFLNISQVDTSFSKCCPEACEMVNGQTVRHRAQPVLALISWALTDVWMLYAFFSNVLSAALIKFPLNKREQVIVQLCGSCLSGWFSLMLLS